MKQQLGIIAVIMLLLGVHSAQLQAQVSIGSSLAPNENAVLDLHSNEKKGLLLPRIPLKSTIDMEPMEHVQGMFVYNTDTAGTPPYDVTPGVYYNNGEHWVRLDSAAKQPWIYLPPFDLKWKVDSTGLEVDLYKQYTDNLVSLVKASPGAPISLPGHAGNATDFYYAVTRYPSESIINLVIDESGVMTYDCVADEDKAPMKPDDFFIIILIRK